MKSACSFQAELPVQFQAILVIFLSVRMIEFNHLSNEKVHVTSEQNNAGS